MSTENKNLYYLKELSGYKIANDYSDVRGWQVIDADNRVIGKVDGLLVNMHAERVLYLDVEVDEGILRNGFGTSKISANNGVHGFLNSEEENHIIIPIGMVRLDESERKVISSDINDQTFRTIKRFGKSTDITREYERDMFNSYVPDAKTEVTRG